MRLATRPVSTPTSSCSPASGRGTQRWLPAKMRGARRGYPPHRRAFSGFFIYLDRSPWRLSAMAKALTQHTKKGQCCCLIQVKDASAVYSSACRVRRRGLLREELRFLQCANRGTLLVVPHTAEGVPSFFKQSHPWILEIS